MPSDTGPDVSKSYAKPLRRPRSGIVFVTILENMQPTLAKGKHANRLALQKAVARPVIGFVFCRCLVFKMTKTY